MGIYLNSKTPYSLYKEAISGLYFVDKTNMLVELITLVEQGNKYICVTRPRRFGKTIMANMISSFFVKGRDSKELFKNLKIKNSKLFEKYKNSYNVIHISLNEIPKNCKTYEQYISRIENKLIKDLKLEFPDYNFEEEEAVWDILQEIYEQENNIQFVFVLDEWDYPFHRNFVTEKDKLEYLEFLNNLLKGKAYVAFAYMTGILPIAKYSSGSELNMFLEYTMVSEEVFSDSFGFTENEVDELYCRYLKESKNQKITREGLRIWYDGYHTCSGNRIYNPRSVVAALLNNNLGSYWTSSGPYDEIYYYVEKNIAEVRDDLALMVSGEPVLAKVREYAATSMNLSTREEILSAMVVYGFLSYEKAHVFIPNKELMDNFNYMLQKEPSLGYIHRLSKESERMLKATLAGDTNTMIEILEYAHNTEIPLLSYNNETDLTTVVNLVYLSARDFYRIEREDKAGIGYVDFIFYPEINKNADCIILELKIDHTPEEAIQQIKKRKYALRFQGKLGEKEKYKGRILAVGIAYDRITKKHDCKIEVL